AGDLEPAAANLSDRFDGADVNPSQRRISALASVQRSVRPGLDVFADALISHRNARQRSSGIRANLPVPSFNPFYVNPTGGSDAILVAYQFGKDLGPVVTHAAVTTLNIGLGSTLDLPSKWRVSSQVARALETSDVTTEGLVSYRALLASLFD